MNHCARVLAARSAPLAEAYCDQLRQASSGMAARLRERRPVEALEAFERALAPMQKMLVFAFVSESLLRDAQHPLRPDLEAFSSSLCAALTRIEEAIVDRDFEAMLVALETAMIPTLERYPTLGPRLTSALSPRLAA